MPLITSETSKPKEFRFACQYVYLPQNMLLAQCYIVSNHFPLICNIANVAVLHQKSSGPSRGTNNTLGAGGFTTCLRDTPWASTGWGAGVMVLSTA